MHGLIKTVNQIAHEEMSKKVRSKTIDGLTDIIKDIESGIEIWNDYLSSAGSSETGLFGGWTGFGIDKPLFDLNLTTHSKSNRISNGASSLDDPIIELAYTKLLDDQTAKDAALNAVETMEKRIEHVNELINLVKTTKPKKPKTAKITASSGKKTAKPSGVKKPIAKGTKNKKTTKKKVAKKSAKKSTAKTTVAKKKVVKKAPAKKKVAKKKAAKKKVVKKTATKTNVSKKKTAKKSVKKKTVAKKVNKKIPTKKKSVKKKSVKKKSRR